MNSSLYEDKTYTLYEKDVLDYWKTEDIYSKIKDSEKRHNTVFDFCNGPPFISSNTLHIGHLMVESNKDAMLRYQRMHSKQCKNLLNFDVHGLPSETVVMKKLNLNSTLEILDYGIAKFNKECKDVIHNYSEAWKPLYDRLGRWSDFSSACKTMDTKYMESCWYIFSLLYKKNLVYKAFKVMPYTYKLETSLSNFEISDTYKNIKSKSVYVLFELLKECNTYLVAWTTTVYTLPCNVALCVGPRIKYMLCEDYHGNKYIVAESSINNLQKKFVSIQFYSYGEDMKGLEYKPIFNYINYRYHRVLVDDYVKENPEYGTSIVHLSPSQGDDDYRICIDNGVLTSQELKEVCPINSNGTFSNVMEDLSGILIFDTVDILIAKLKSNNSILRIQQIDHQYPHCPRTGVPIMYLALPCYFIDVPKIKDRMIELNKSINWSQDKIGSGRFHNWLMSSKPWCISRTRVFGTPLPIMVSDDGDTLVIESINDLISKTGIENITDIHPEYVHNLTIRKNGKIFRFEPYVFDCWFESGCVPYAQLHWPFENREVIDSKSNFLSEFVAESQDQTRGWFYTLLVISTAISDMAPFKNVICNGIITDEKGEKYSKSKGNSPDSFKLLDTYGADVIRLYLLSSPVTRCEDLKFNITSLNETKQKFILYINSVKFFVENYINMCKVFEDSKIDIIDTFNLSHDFDKWILEKSYILRLGVEQHMNSFHPDAAVKLIIDFFEDLANWYIKFNRDRLKGNCGKHEWTISLSTLMTVIKDFTLILSPFAPFYSEYVYGFLKQVLPENLKTFSIHNLLYPSVTRNYNTISKFTILQKITCAIRTFRDKSKSHKSVKVPIKNCTIYIKNDILNDIVRDITLIQKDINCLNFTFDSYENSGVNFIVKPVVKTIGMKHRKKSKMVIEAFKNLKFEDIINDTLLINLGNEVIELTNDCFYIEAETKGISIDDIVITIDDTYDKNLYNEYQLRMLCSFIQKIKKSMKLKYWNQLEIYYKDTNNVFKTFIESHVDEVYEKIKSNILEYNHNLNYHGFTSYRYTFQEFDDSKHNINFLVKQIQ